MKSRDYLPMLYQGTKQWCVSVDGAAVRTTYGKIGGKQQTTSEVAPGVHKGKSNELTPHEHARQLAVAKWTKKQNNGYTKTKGQTEPDKAFVKGGIWPMLADKWKDRKDKVKYPMLVQPKLDGMRCIAVIVNGKCTLWSRKRKPITCLPHIVKALEQKFKGKTITFDGEAYDHEQKNNFQGIIKGAKRTKANKDSLRLKYHIYDIVSPMNQESRSDCLNSHYRSLECDAIAIVRTGWAESHKSVEAWHELCIKDGYEGCMLRDPFASYESKSATHRSKCLLKVKDHDENEFEIVGVVPGKGRMAEAAVFVCKLSGDDGNEPEFNCKMKGSTERLKEILKNKDEYIGKWLTVRHLGWYESGIPREPVGKEVRDYE